MTPAQLEHLRAIDAHLAKLLEDIAAKRTPGEWKNASRSETSDIIGNDEICGGVYIASVSRIAWGAMDSEHGDANAAFIASCAGNAEAGWRATRAAIKGLLATCEGFTFPDEDRPEAYAALQDILAAFPLESIK